MSDKPVLAPWVNKATLKQKDHEIRLTNDIEKILAQHGVGMLDEDSDREFIDELVDVALHHLEPYVIMWAKIVDTLENP